MGFNLCFKVLRAKFFMCLLQHQATNNGGIVRKSPQYEPRSHIERSVRFYAAANLSRGLKPDTHYLGGWVVQKLIWVLYGRQKSLFPTES